MGNHVRNNNKCVADVVFREVGKSINFGKVVIDTETYSFEGNLTLDNIKGIFKEGSYVIIYTPNPNTGDPQMMLFADMEVTGNPVKDLNKVQFVWDCENSFPTLELKFERVYTE